MKANLPVPLPAVLPAYPGFMRWALASLVIVGTALLILGGIMGRVQLRACCADLRRPESVDRLPRT